MSDLYRRFRDLTKGQPILSGEVTTHNADGTSTVTLTGGGVVRADGQDHTVTSKVFIRGFEILGVAPSLPSFNLEV